MTKSCQEIFSGIDHSIIGNPHEEIKGIAYRSDKVEPGDIFFCIVGTSVDGHTFAQDAINRGARALVVQRKVYLADATDVTEVVVKDSRKAMAQAAANFYDRPSHDFQLAGITGTNGKTTTAYLLDHIARVSGKRTGVIGTVGVQIGSRVESSTHTTPESPDLQRIFADMRDEDCDIVTMEVSSHALDLERVWASKFAVTAFTNLSQDHLDFHKTFESYFEAKARLFSSDYPAKRVICIDDEWGKEILRRCASSDDDVLTTGFNESALIHPVTYEISSDSTELTLDICGVTHECNYPLVGRHNIENVMTAFAIALQLGIKSELIVDALATAPQIPGRLERVLGPKSSELAVFIDYAHTPDALKKSIASVKSITKGRTLVVFGCGGNRDASKRSIMGRISLDADQVVVTSDNPRHEDPQAIINDIMAGIQSAKERVFVEVDRKKAIALAISRAQAGDSILIAGKGHEDYQLVGDEVLHFDDVEVARDELEKRFQV
ncbi:MAG: UDP-N-acetylmuramoyl-L-alanyl-D-glutamate--2,6-diaminopimelate ligase [Raoultibacter sp.]|jgi:UDP-N-acetylmuramoyl-L-alanyl-D-glutamate--2,6-diaminopimelate ligase